MLLQTARPATVIFHLVSLYVQSLARPACSDPDAGRFNGTLPGKAGCTVVAARRVRRCGTVRLKKARPSPAAVAIIWQDPNPMLLGLGEAEKVAASSACQDNGLPHPPLSVAAEKYFPIGGAVDIPNLAAGV